MDFRRCSLADASARIDISGSHLSGREPNDQVNPSFQGRAPVSMLGKAGDAYIMNNQTWCVDALCVPCGILDIPLCTGTGARRR